MGMYDTETTLQLILDKSSLTRASKSIADNFNKSISGLKGQFQAGRAGQEGIYGLQGAGAGIVRGAGKVAGGIEKSGMIGGFGKALGPVLKALGPIAIIAAVISELWQFIAPIFKLFSLVLLTLWMPVLKLMKPFFVDVPKKLEDMKTFFRDLPGKIAEAISGFLNAAGETLADVGKGIGDFGQWLWDTLISIFATQLHILTDIGKWVWDTLVNVFDTGLHILGDIGTFLMTTLENIFTTALDVLSSIGDFVRLVMEGKFGEAFKVLKDIGQKVIDLVMGTIESGKSVLEDIGQDVLDLIMKTITSGISVLADIGKDISDLVMKTITPIIPKGRGGGAGMPTVGMLPGFNIITNMARKATEDFAKSLINPQQDFISRPGTKPIPFSSDYTLIGMKDLSKLKGNETSLDYSPIYNVSAGTDRNELKRIFEEHDEKVKRELQSALSYVTNLRG